MILNGSSAQTFQQCRQKAWNWRELRLESKREAESLTIGAAFHAGQAARYKGASESEIRTIVETTYRAEMGEEMVLPEEEQLIVRNIRFAQNSILEHSRHWKDESFQVLMPEVKFRVALPESEHHCWFVHRKIENDFMRERYHRETNTGCLNKDCYQPHYYTGTTDAVISTRNVVMLLEHKTTSVFSDLFLEKFRLDKQPRQYIYGIWKSTGIRPSGFILNVIRKPNKNAADPTRPTGFARESYIVSDRELADVEKELIQIANNYETAFRLQDIYKTSDTNICIAYNRKCYYFNSCVTGEIDPSEYSQRAADYVDDQYDEILKEVK